MSALPYYLIFLVPVSVVAGYTLGGLFTFITPLFVFVLVPVLDILMGVSKENLSHQEEHHLKDALHFKIITWFCVPVQVTLVFWGAFVIAYEMMDPVEAAGFVLSVGISSGILGINVSHELQHRVNNELEPLLARFMLWTVGYMHWAVEHIAGHHRNVATLQDPATARLGESFFAFLPRTVFGGFRSAWQIERRRMEKRGSKVWGPGNRILRYTAAEIALISVFGLFLGAGAALYFIVQSVIAWTLLEMVNYIEHYGLMRKKIDGRYEPVNITHSWNSSNYLTNRFLFNLQRHSDHHFEPGRRYQILRHFDQSPQLPTGYAGMILLAAVPPLWKRIMDPRIPVNR